MAISTAPSRAHASAKSGRKFIASRKQAQAGKASRAAKWRRPDAIRSSMREPGRFASLLFHDFEDMVISLLSYGKLSGYRFGRREGEVAAEVQYCEACLAPVARPHNNAFFLFAFCNVFGHTWFSPLTLRSTGAYFARH
jgi:hypothetical protein